ncbi:MAG: NUDIX domain-containing protein [Nitrospira sp.]
MKYCPQCSSLLAPKLVDGTSRLACQQETCGFVHWDNPIPVVAALVLYQDHYLIARHAGWPNGLFSLITGYLERNETPEQAVVREVREELGLASEVTRHIGNYSFMRKNQLLLAYEVAASGTLNINKELIDLRHLLPIDLAGYDFGPLSLTQTIVKEWCTLEERAHNNSN